MAKPGILSKKNEVKDGTSILPFSDIKNPDNPIFE